MEIATKEIEEVNSKEINKGVNEGIEWRFKSGWSRLILQTCWH